MELSLKICVIEVPGRKKTEAETIFVEIMAENFPELLTYQPTHS